MTMQPDLFPEKAGFIPARPERSTQGSGIRERSGPSFDETLRRQAQSPAEKRTSNQPRQSQHQQDLKPNKQILPTNKGHTEPYKLNELKRPMRAWGHNLKKESGDFNDYPALAFLSGQLTQDQSHLLPKIVSENPFITEALSQNLQGFFENEKPLGDIANSLGIGASLEKISSDLGINPDTSISPGKFFKLLGIDPSRVMAELSILKQNLPLGGLSRFMSAGKNQQPDPSSEASGTSMTDRISHGSKKIIHGATNLSSQNNLSQPTTPDSETGLRNPKNPVNLADSVGAEPQIADHHFGNKMPQLSQLNSDTGIKNNQQNIIHGLQQSAPLSSEPGLTSDLQLNTSPFKPDTRLIQESGHQNPLNPMVSDQNHPLFHSQNVSPWSALKPEQNTHTDPVPSDASTLTKESGAPGIQRGLSLKNEPEELSLTRDSSETSLNTSLLSQTRPGTFNPAEATEQKPFRYQNDDPNLRDPQFFKPERVISETGMQQPVTVAGLTNKLIPTDQPHPESEPKDLRPEPVSPGHRLISGRESIQTLNQQNANQLHRAANHLYGKVLGKQAEARPRTGMPESLSIEDENHKNLLSAKKEAFIPAAASETLSQEPGLKEPSDQQLNQADNSMNEASQSSGTDQRAETIDQIRSRILLLNSNGGGFAKLDIPGSGQGYASLGVQVEGSDVKLKMLSSGDQLQQLLGQDLSSLKESLASQKLILSETGLQADTRENPQNMHQGRDQLNSGFQNQRDNYQQQQASFLPEFDPETLMPADRRIQDKPLITGYPQFQSGNRQIELQI